MQLNENIWGSEHGNFWYAALGTEGPKFTQYIEDGNSFFAASFERLTQNGVEYSNGQLSKMAQLHPDQYNKLIDTSICYAAIPASSPLASVSYLNRTSTEAGLYEAYRGQIPLFLSIAYNGHETNASSSMGCTGDGNGLLSNRWAQWSQEAIAKWDPETEYPTGGRWIIPITKYNYNDVVLVIKVIVGNDLSNPQSFSTLDLADWEANKAANPYLYCCYGIPYIGKAGNRFNINNNVSIAYPGFGTSTTRANYLRCSRNIEIAAPPNYHNNDVNDYDQSTPLINYSSERWLNSRGSGNNRYVGTYGFSIGCGNASVTPNSSLNTFAATGSIDGDSNLYLVNGDSSLFESFPFTSTSRVVTLLHSNTDVRKLMSWYGLQFVDSTGKVNAALGSEDLCLPIITEEGYTTDEYRTGEEALELSNAEWGEDFRDKNGWGTGDPTPWEDDPTTVLRVPIWNSGVNASYWALTETEFANVINTFSIDDYNWALNFEVADEDYNTYNFRTHGPYSSITETFRFAIAYPFDVTRYLAVANHRIIKAGYVQVGDTSGATLFSEILGNSSQFWVPGGSCDYFKYFDNFLDFEPYTTAELYIPYHGSVSLDPKLFCGHTISVRYLIDWESGASLALIYRDGLVVDQISGQMGIQIPTSAPDYSNWVANIFQAHQQTKAAKISTTSSAINTVTKTAAMAGAGLMTGGVGGAIIGGAIGLASGLASTKQGQIQQQSAEYNLEHQALVSRTLSSGTPAIGTANEQACRLIIYRPKFLEGYSKNNFRNYGHTTGFACLENKALNNFHGLTVCSSIDLTGVSCSSSEAEMIKNALKSGVYLP